jgi:hypothetical protein
MDLETKHNQAIREEIGHRLRRRLTPEQTRIPPRLRQLALRLDQEYLAREAAPPIAPDIDMPDDPVTRDVDPLTAWLNKLRLFRKR